MRSKEEVVAKFKELVELRDSCTDGSSARRILNYRLQGVAWVLKHPEISDLVLNKNVRDLLDCLS